MEGWRGGAELCEMPNRLQLDVRQRGPSVLGLLLIKRQCSPIPFKGDVALAGARTFAACLHRFFCLLLRHCLGFTSTPPP